MFTKELLRRADHTMLRSDDGLIDVLVTAEGVTAGRYRVVAIGARTVTAVIARQALQEPSE